MSMAVLPLSIIQYFSENEALLWLFGLMTLLLFLASLIAIPLVVINIPTDYFTHDYRHTPPWSKHHTALRLLLLLLKNLFGLVFVVAGLVMLVLPGQGLLTILIGITLLDFPGKYKSEVWLISKKPVLVSVNWLRLRSGRKALRVDP